MTTATMTKPGLCFQVNTRELVAALREVLPFTQKKSPHEVVGSVLAEARDGELRLSATNFAASIVRRVPAEVSEPGSALVLAQMLSGAVREVTGDALAIQMDEAGQLRVESAGVRFRIQCSSADAYPEIGDGAGFDSVRLSGAALADGIRRTSFATAGMAGAHFSLNAVQVEVGDGQVCLNASDSRALALWSAEIEGESGLEGQWLVPPMAFRLAAAQIAASRSVEIAFGDRQVFLRFETGGVIARLVDGRYPVLKTFGRRPSRVVATVEVSALLRGLKQAMLVEDKEMRGVDLELVDGGIRLRREVALVGAADVTVPASHKAVGQRTKFDGRLWIAGLSAMNTTAKVSVSWSGLPSDAVHLTDVDDYAYIVTPLFKV